MKNLILILLLTVLSHTTYTFAQEDSKVKTNKNRKDRAELEGPNKEQSIAWIDKIVSDIKSEKETYRKITGETNILSNIKENIYKKDKEIIIIQIEDTYYKNVSDYYINRDRIVYMETKNNDNTIDKRYYDLNFSYLIADYRNGHEIEVNYPLEDKLQMGYAMQEEIEKINKVYKKK